MNFNIIDGYYVASQRIWILTFAPRLLLISDSERDDTSNVSLTCRVIKEKATNPMMSFEIFIIFERKMVVTNYFSLKKYPKKLTESFSHFLRNCIGEANPQSSFLIFSFFLFSAIGVNNTSHNYFHEYKLIKYKKLINNDSTSTGTYQREEI